MIIDNVCSPTWQVASGPCLAITACSRDLIVASTWNNHGGGFWKSGPLQTVQFLKDCYLRTLSNYADTDLISISNTNDDADAIADADADSVTLPLVVWQLSPLSAFPASSLLLVPASGNEADQNTHIMIELQRLNSCCLELNILFIISWKCLNVHSVCTNFCLNVHSPGLL